MNLNLPSTYSYMGGVEPAYIRDAAGTAWWSAYCYKGPRGGGQYVFKQVGDGVATEVQYGPLMTGRGLACLQPDGTLVLAASDGTVAHAFVIPGFAVKVGAAITYTPNPILTPVVDQDARRVAAEAKAASTSASGKADKASKAVVVMQQQITALPPPVTDQHINDLIWAKCADRIFAELENPNSGISSLILAMIEKAK